MHHRSHDQRGLHPVGSACRGSASNGDLPLGGGSASRGSAFIGDLPPEGSASRGSTSREVCIQGLCIGGGGGQTPDLPIGGGELGRSAYRGGADLSPRDTWDTAEYSQQAGGRYPTGMLSCYSIRTLCLT